MIHHLRKRIALLALCALLFGLLAGCGVKAEKNGETAKALTIEDFAEAKMGILTGSAHELTAKKYFPDAERVYFSGLTDMVLAVEQGKIDCYLEDAPFLASVVWEGANVQAVEGAVMQMENGFIFPEEEASRALREELNAFIEKAKAEGMIEELKAKWLGAKEPTEHPNYMDLPGENGTIRLAAVIDSKPMLYRYKEQCTGFEMELLTAFGREHGYNYDIEEVPFHSVIAGIATGKYDMAASSLNITPEREESVDFTVPYTAFDVVIVTAGDSEEKRATGKTRADFETATIGVLTGSVYEDFAKEHFPNAERAYYNIISDMILAVEQGKIDGYISETPYVTAAVWEGASVTAMEEVLARTHAGYIFQKGGETAQLREELDAFILAAKESGLLDELKAKWFGPTEPEGDIGFDGLTGENGTLRIAVAPDLKPNSYIKDNQLTGYEIELLVRFAEEYGYKLEAGSMTFDAILPGVTTGKYDIGAGAVTITEERAKSVDFSESHLSVDVVMVVAAEETAAQSSFWDEVKEDFEKTFIREDRWKLILSGVGVTMLISICSVGAGTVLGFALYLLSRSDRKPVRALARGVAKVYSRIIEGTPTVVVLMILFYVVFAKFRDMSGVLVAIIGFTLTFGAFVYDHMTLAVNSVDRGQTEAAFALGYTKNKTFLRIVLPQAMTIFLPTYCGHAVELIKATAVVGYVAVNDLTKIGDIIRSNTYEAFFPLMATAAIYFLLTWFIALLLGRVKALFEPKRRSKEQILKGVKSE